MIVFIKFVIVWDNYYIRLSLSVPMEMNFFFYIEVPRKGSDT